MEARSLRCDGCGAPLPAPEGTWVVCAYCRRDLEIVEGGAEVRDQRRARGLTDRLLRGPASDEVGEAQRMVPSELTDAGWQDVEHTVWASEATASSSWGAGWSASALVGRPKVFPLHGDIAGAWAPATRDSAVEWVEVTFDGPPILASAIRVFETHLPGATFAATCVDGDDEEQVWQRAPVALGAPSRLLEIRLEPPREVHKIRLYIDNSLGSSWSEIDAVGLTSVEPLPPERRQAPWKRAKPRDLSFAVLGLLALFVLVPVALYLALGASTEEGGDGLGEATPLANSQMMVWNVSRPGLSQAGVLWASQVQAFSSEYTNDANAAHQALGLPDVFPGGGDDRRAWAPGARDSGPESITLGFTSPVRASAVAVVETEGAGALAYVMDVTPGQDPVVLWRGRTGVEPGARVLSIELPSPRVISAVRIGLDTTRVSGWNEIDAVGLVPARARE